MTKRYTFIDQDDSGDVTAYPATDPYVIRDQGLYAADELLRCVISDVRTVLSVAGFDDEADKAEALFSEAETLPWNDGRTWVDNDVDPNGSESLHNLCESAENLPHALVIWDGDMGTVRITTSVWVSNIDPMNDLTADERREHDIEA